MSWTKREYLDGWELCYDKQKFLTVFDPGRADYFIQYFKEKQVVPGKELEKWIGEAYTEWVKFETVMKNL